ncbi:MAG: hypothetical protein HUU02_09025 [Bacteroidetes bacterium]|nr:hypothetical protein [Bacteroidota bacterium]
MNHYSEHMLDLYVRNSSEAADQRAAIEQHLAECAACRAIALDLREFYALADDGKRALPSGETEEALTVRTEYISTRPLTAVPVKDALPVRVWRSARRRPVTASLSLFAMTALLLFSWKQFSPARDLNPVEFNYSTAAKQIIVYNKAGELLWTLSVRDLGPAEEAVLQHRRAKMDMILDIDNDGINEFLTTRHVVSVNTGEYRTINIFNADGSFRSSRSVAPREVRFRDQHYDRQFEPVFLLFDSTSRSLFVAASNLRSPWVLQRYDRSFRLLGEYWHYGGIQFAQVDIDNDGRTEIALYGKNDVEDVTMGDFAFLSILDPEAVIGSAEDGTTRGFGMEASAAARYTMRFPVPDVNKTMKKNPSVLHILNETTEGFDIFVAAELDPGKPQIGLEYHFSKSAERVTAVRWNTGFEAFHQRLKQEGRISSDLGPDYLNGLVRGIQYWDGHQWLSGALL